MSFLPFDYPCVPSFVALLNLVLLDELSTLSPLILLFYEASKLSVLVLLLIVQFLPLVSVLELNVDVDIFYFFILSMCF